MSPEWHEVFKPTVLLAIVLFGIPLWVFQGRLRYRLQTQHSATWVELGSPTNSNPGRLRVRLRLSKFYWSTARFEALNDSVLSSLCRRLRALEAVEVLLFLSLVVVPLQRG